MANPHTARFWEVTSEKVEAAVRRIIEVSRPQQLILFGSYIRGETKVNSDLDILVVVPDDIKSPRQESVRIRRELRDILMPMDILVVPHGRWEQLKELPGTVYREAWMRGRIVYES
ncbi:MAG: nucleotidyltransferase domain-containing protein [Candidatus Methylomirabilis sp.]|nr:nucleotidyltransferase domain-containing protein [Candidatus Methylomirabilis sp.]